MIGNKILKVSSIILGILAALYLLTIAFLPSIIDKNYHAPRGEIDQLPTERALRIYNDLSFIGDLHSDALLWRRNLAKVHRYGQVDIPRLRKAKVDLQVFSIVSKSPRGLNFEQNADDAPDNITSLYLIQGRPLKSLKSLVKRAEVQARALNKLEEDKNVEFKIIRSASDLIQLDLEKKDGARHTAGLLALEGAHVLEGNISNVQVMYDAGVRMVGFTHFFDNELGGSGQGIQKGGITEFGLLVLKELEKKSMIIDLAHASDALFHDIINQAKRPLLVSHTGIVGEGNCLPTRNLTDEKIKAVANSGGIIGIAFLEELICSSKLSEIAKQMKYITELVGVEHVAMGSDADGSVPTIVSLEQMPLLVDELLKIGFSERDIGLIMGENMKQFLLENLPKD